jgi:DNA invertase Pin-like site-specific DNA recombinase
MAKAAIYARYSTSNQKDTSIEDQVRRCTEIARRHGYEVEAALIFSDAAISGSDEVLDKRAGYSQLLAAWDERAFNALVVDEVSRLARGNMELARLQERVEATRVRLITADGIDSAQPAWGLLFSVIGAVAQQSRRETRHRVTRGMLGQLERGFMIADAPFGYRRVVETSNDGTTVGTRWEIDEKEGAIVREMYAMRRAGRSYRAIAAWLNRQGILAPGRPRICGKSYWRQGTVYRLLSNTIFVGVFTWQGSAFCRAKARRSGRTLEPRAFARPELRLVDDETWRICNDRTPRAHRGGRRHLLAGLLSCGECRATLTVKVAGGRESAYCASCAAAKAVGVKAAFLGYVSTAGAREALEHVLRRIFSDKAVEAFRRRLRERLSSSHEQERARLVRLLAQATRACERLARHLRDQHDDDPIIDKQYREAAADRRRLELELKAFDVGQPSAEERAALERQLQVDPLAVLSRLLRGEGDVERMQAVLGRLFPRIALVGRPARHVAIYEIEVAPAVGFAIAASGKPAFDQREVLTVEVRCSAHRPTRWLVQILEDRFE